METTETTETTETMAMNMLNVFRAIGVGCKTAADFAQFIKGNW